MIQISIPGRNWEMNFEHLVLDLNGTLAVDGLLIPGVRERIEQLKSRLKVYVLTADTFGAGAAIARELGTELFQVRGRDGGEDKRDFIKQIGPEKTVAIGNGYNDIFMLREAALGIAVIGAEGCAVEAIRHADIVVRDINDALDCLNNPMRIIATLRS